MSGEVKMELFPLDNGKSWHSLHLCCHLFWCALEKPLNPCVLATDTVWGCGWWRRTTPEFIKWKIQKGGLICLIHWVSCPLFTWITLPKTTLSTVFGSTFPASSAAAEAQCPIVVAVVSFNIPPNVPKGVLFAATINTALEHAILNEILDWVKAFSLQIQR